jgi:hypothetical protein
MNDSDWVPAKEAVKRLKNHCDHPRTFLLSLLREGSVTARAASVRRDGVLIKQAPFLKRNGPQIKTYFWKLVSEEDWSAGIFQFDEPAPSELFDVGETLCWRTEGVELNWLEVLGQAGSLLAKKAKPANRQLDHDAIIIAARDMRVAQPRISIGSAAASIAAELEPNSKTSKKRDPRHIEKIIAPLWGEASGTSPQ